MPVATTTKPTKQDYQAMTRAELEELSALLHTFTDPQWEEPSLCDGWKVRHVIGHMCMGSTMSPLALLPRLVPYRFNLPRASSEESFKYGEAHTPGEMLDTFDRVVVSKSRPGLGKVAPPNEWFVDKLIHQQDIRRPQGMTRTIAPSHLVAALDALPRLGGFIQSKRVCRGLSFVATDVDHRVGSGPEVCGPGEALVLAMSGRPIGLDELSGDGLTTLRERIA
jgi:uncharacterized protein (TIGR03083 family)